MYTATPYLHLKHFNFDHHCKILFNLKSCMSTVVLMIYSSCLLVVRVRQAVVPFLSFSYLFLLFLTYFVLLFVPTLSITLSLPLILHSSPSYSIPPIAVYVFLASFSPPLEDHSLGICFHSQLISSQSFHMPSPLQPTLHQRLIKTFFYLGI